MPGQMTLEKYFKKAQKERWAIGQFNFSNFDVLASIVSAAEKMLSPVILGTSERAIGILGLESISSTVKDYQKKSRVPLFLNLDHGQSFGYIKKVVEAGYAAVQFDGSALLLEENIAQTKKIVAYARKFGVFVEGEVGVIGGEKTRPEDALRFVKDTKVNSLAVAVGNFHGGRSSAQNPNLDLKRLKEIKEKIGSFPLVLHGGSGTPPADVEEAIKIGVAKINISTELKMAADKAAVQKVVENKIILFGSKNKV